MRLCWLGPSLCDPLTSAAAAPRWKLGAGTIEFCASSGRSSSGAGAASGASARAVVVFGRKLWLCGRRGARRGCRSGARPFAEQGEGRPEAAARCPLASLAASSDIAVLVLCVVLLAHAGCMVVDVQESKLDACSFVVSIAPVSCV